MTYLLGEQSDETRKLSEIIIVFEEANNKLLIIASKSGEGNNELILRK